jgi:hypothetical protein
MGKKNHGRLVHEIRAALVERGFKPSKVTQMETANGLRPVHSPGFKVEKHNDGKSVRLSHRMTNPAGAATTSLSSRQSLGCLQLKRLVAYHEPLEEEGYVCIAINSRDPLAIYSLWRCVEKKHFRQDEVDENKAVAIYGL